MPDWDIELTHTLGKGNVRTHLVTIEDVPQQGVAQIAGIEEGLNWTEVPEAARAYWRKAKMEGAMPYEVLTELEKNWNLTFTCKEHVDTRVVATPPAPRTDVRPTPTASNVRGVNSIGLLDQLKQRYIEVIAERKQLDEELDILSRLFGKPKRKYERKAKPSRSRGSALRQSQGKSNRRKDLSGVQKNNRRVRYPVSGPDICDRGTGIREHNDSAIGTDVGSTSGVTQGISAAIDFDAGERN